MPFTRPRIKRVKRFDYERDRKITNRAFGLAFSAVAAKMTKFEPAHLAAIHSVVL